MLVLNIHPFSISSLTQTEAAAASCAETVRRRPRAGGEGGLKRYRSPLGYSKLYVVSARVCFHVSVRPAPVNDHDHRPKTPRISSSNAFCAVRPNREYGGRLGAGGPHVADGLNSYSYSSADLICTVR